MQSPTEYLGGEHQIILQFASGREIFLKNSKAESESFAKRIFSAKCILISR